MSGNHRQPRERPSATQRRGDRHTARAGDLVGRCCSTARVSGKPRSRCRLGASSTIELTARRPSVRAWRARLARTVARWLGSPAGQCCDIDWGRPQPAPVARLTGRGLRDRRGLSQRSPSDATTAQPEPLGRRRHVDWGAVRDLFPLSRDWTHLAGFLLAPNPGASRRRHLAPASDRRAEPGGLRRLSRQRRPSITSIKNLWRITWRRALTSARRRTRRRHWRWRITPQVRADQRGDQ
jgi:hypothetical protein